MRRREGRSERLREVVPDLRSLAIMTKVDASASVREMDELRSMARALGPEVTVAEIAEPRTSHLPSRRSQAARKRFMW
jgi:ABC-type uncharacterized transport system substrate-binding protein